MEAAPREGGRGGSPPAPTAQSSSSSRADTALRTRRISSTLAGAVAGRKRESPPDRPRDHTCGGPGLSPHPYRYMSPAHPGPGNLEERPPAPVQGPGLWEGPQALPTPLPARGLLGGHAPQGLGSELRPMSWLLFLSAPLEFFGGLNTYFTKSTDYLAPCGMKTHHQNQQQTPERRLYFKNAFTHRSPCSPLGGSSFQYEG